MGYMLDWSILYNDLYLVTKAKRKEYSEKDVRNTKYLNDTNYVVMSVVKGNSEMKIADKEIYDVILKDNDGKIVTIRQ